jgi:hypothetical protein
MKIQNLTKGMHEWLMKHAQGQIVELISDDFVKRFHLENNGQAAHRILTCWSEQNIAYPESDFEAYKKACIGTGCFA